MKNNIPCEVIRDLFPLYIDELTSEVTNKQIEEHVMNCTDCKNVLNAMKAPDAMSGDDENSSDEKEIDFLKKTKKKNQRIAIGGIIATFLLVLIITLSYRYIVGFNMKINPDEWVVMVDGKHVQINCEPEDERLTIKRLVTSEKDGIIRISYKCAYKKSKYEDTGFLDYQSGLNEIKEIWIGDQLVWQEGVRISKMAMDVYEASHSYMGDASANARTAQALKMGEKLGGFTYELDSSGERLKISILMDKKVKKDEVNRVVLGNKTCESYGYIMIATIDNLDEVEFRWYEQEDENSFYSRKVQKEDIKDIKNAGKTPAGIQRLMDSLGLTK